LALWRYSQLHRNEWPPGDAAGDGGVSVVGEPLRWQWQLSAGRCFAAEDGGVSVVGKPLRWQ